MVIDTDRGDTILLPIDYRGISAYSLGQLVRIAEKLNRRVLGLLLDDPNLKRLADLPFATEIGICGGYERRLIAPSLYEGVNSGILKTKQLLTDMAQHHEVNLTFDSASGRRLQMALNQNGFQEAYLPVGEHRKITPSKPHPGCPCIRNLGVLLVDCDQSEHVLDTARALIQAGMVGSIYVIADSSLNPQQLASLSHPKYRLCLQPRIKPTPDAIIRMIRQSAYDQLFVPVDCLIGIPAEVLESAIEYSSSEILIIK